MEQFGPETMDPPHGLDVGANELLSSILRFVSRPHDDDSEPPRSTQNPLPSACTVLWEIVTLVCGVQDPCRESTLRPAPALNVFPSTVTFHCAAPVGVEALPEPLASTSMSMK